MDPNDLYPDFDPLNPPLPSGKSNKGGGGGGLFSLGMGRTSSLSPQRHDRSNDISRQPFRSDSVYRPNEPAAASSSDHARRQQHPQPQQHRRSLSAGDSPWENILYLREQSLGDMSEMTMSVASSPHHHHRKRLDHDVILDPAAQQQLQQQQQQLHLYGPRNMTTASMAQRTREVEQQDDASAVSSAGTSKWTHRMFRRGRTANNNNNNSAGRNSQDEPPPPTDAAQSYRGGARPLRSRGGEHNVSVGEQTPYSPSQSSRPSRPLRTGRNNLTASLLPVQEPGLESMSSGQQQQPRFMKNSNNRRTVNPKASLLPNTNTEPGLEEQQANARLQASIVPVTEPKEPYRDNEVPVGQSIHRGQQQQQQPRTRRFMAPTFRKGTVRMGAAQANTNLRASVVQVSEPGAEEPFRVQEPAMRPTPTTTTSSFEDTNRRPAQQQQQQQPSSRIPIFRKGTVRMGAAQTNTNLRASVLQVSEPGAEEPFRVQEPALRPTTISNQFQETNLRPGQEQPSSRMPNVANRGPGQQQPSSRMPPFRKGTVRMGAAQANTNLRASVLQASEPGAEEPFRVQEPAMRPTPTSNNFEETNVANRRQGQEQQSNRMPNVANRRPPQQQPSSRMPPFRKGTVRMGAAQANTNLMSSVVQVSEPGAEEPFRVQEPAMRPTTTSNNFEEPNVASRRPGQQQPSSRMPPFRKGTVRMGAAQANAYLRASVLQVSEPGAEEPFSEKPAVRRPPPERIQQQSRSGPGGAVAGKPRTVAPPFRTGTVRMGTVQNTNLRASVVQVSEPGSDEPFRVEEAAKVRFQPSAGERQVGRGGALSPGRGPQAHRSVVAPFRTGAVRMGTVQNTNLRASVVQVNEPGADEPFYEEPKAEPAMRQPTVDERPSSNVATLPGQRNKRSIAPPFRTGVVRMGTVQNTNLRASIVQVSEPGADEPSYKKPSAPEPRGQKQRRRRRDVSPKGRTNPNIKASLLPVREPSLELGPEPTSSDNVAVFSSGDALRGSNNSNQYQKVTGALLSDSASIPSVREPIGSPSSKGVYSRREHEATFAPELDRATTYDAFGPQYQGLMRESGEEMDDLGELCEQTQQRRGHRRVISCPIDITVSLTSTREPGQDDDFHMSNVGQLRRGSSSRVLEVEQSKSSFAASVPSTREPDGFSHRAEGGGAPTDRPWPSGGVAGDSHGEGQESGELVTPMTEDTAEEHLYKQVHSPGHLDDGQAFLNVSGRSTVSSAALQSQEPKLVREQSRGGFSRQSSISFSAVGAGDSMRIVPIDAALSPSQRALRRQSLRGMRDSIVRSIIVQGDNLHHEEIKACEEWTCNSCSYINGQCDSRCAICGSEQTIQSRENSRRSLFRSGSSRHALRSSVVLRSSLNSEGPWMCGTCTYVNENSFHLSCEVCGEPRANSAEATAEILEGNETDEAAFAPEDAELMEELEQKVMGKERVIELFEEQAEILADLEAMDGFDPNSDPPDLDHFSQNMEGQRRRLDEIREELVRGLEQEHNEQEAVEQVQERRKSHILDTAGVNSLDVLVASSDASKASPASAEALEWMAQQRMLDEWRSEVEARAMQLEEMYLQQKEMFETYKSVGGDNSEAAA